jgi:hypothetical protein
VVAVSVEDAPDDGPSAPVSRLSKTNPADPENRRHGPSRGESLKRPLTERDGVSLRAEVCNATTAGVDALSWRESVRRWRHYINDQKGVMGVFEDASGNTAKGSDPHRFSPEYADKQYAKLKDLERGMQAEYGRRLHTAMLTFTASSTDDDGRPLPPVDHLDELDESWSAVTRALRRELDGRRWERLAILEPHKSGYLHIHMAVFVEGVVSKETFAPVIDAHVRNCDLASADAHDVEDDTTISVRWAGGDRDDGDDDHLDELAIYLAEYLGTYGDDPLDSADHVQMANAVLWATGKQRWRPSNGAQAYMATASVDDTTTWEFVGIEDGDGEFHEAAAAGGGVTRLETATDVRDEPPPDETRPMDWGELSRDAGNR